MKPKDIESYIKSAPKRIQPKLRQLREVVKTAVPESREKISYGMPYFDYRGRLAYFAYFKDHISFFAMPPIPDKYKKKLKVTGKSTIRFNFDEKIPIKIMEDVVRERAKRNDIRWKSKSKPF